jgi:DNA-binding transcriptional regulator YiaG
MPDIGKLLKDEIRRLAAKEIRVRLDPLAREVRELRKQLNEQRRLTAGLDRAARRLTAEADARRADALKASEDEIRSARISAGSIRRLRDKLGLSRESFAALLHVSANAVYLWEASKSVPRTRAKAKLIELRKLGVRDVRRRLEELEAEQQ